MPRKCYVQGCTSVALHTYRFPQLGKDKSRCLAWLAVCGNITLLDVSPENLRNRSVCSRHFEKKYILAKKLSTSAVPTLHLPEKIDVSSYKFIDDKENNTLNQNDKGKNTGSQGKGLQIISTNKFAASHQAIVEDESKATLSLLPHFNLSRRTNLSAKEKRIYNVIAHLRKTARKAQKWKVSPTEKLGHAEKLLGDGSWNVIVDMPETSKKFLMSYFRNMKGNKYHRQYSIHDKVLALALYNRSTEAYNFMQSIFSLPSVKTLRKLITTIPVQPGICTVLFQTISERIERLNDDKAHYCVLLFKETSLDPSLHYNQRTGTVDGFADNGYEREPQIATHATVWMLKGVQGNWKQPILYTLCHSTAKWEDIVRTYKDIVREAAKFGLIILSSICDQGATNVRAQKHLIESSKREALSRGETLHNDLIIIDGQVIVPIFDPTHLVKCVRNNLLTKDVKFTLSDGVERIAKWSHIQTAYEIDKSRSSLRTMKKLTDYHVEKEKIKKRKVKYCTQVFSNTVAAVMDLMSRCRAHCASGTVCMPSAGQDTALFIEFMNNLFDSVNGKSTHKGMTSTTESDDNWNNCITVLRSMSFIKSKPGDVEKPIVLKNWIQTLQGFKFLKKYLKELGFKDFSTRVFNQDALKNFFRQIKQHGMRNTKPNCSSFRAHYCALLLNNFTQKNTRCNCGCDEPSYFLEDLENIVIAPIVKKEFELPSRSISLSDVPHKEFEINLKLFKESSQSSDRNCQTCHFNMFGKSDLDSKANGHSRFDDGLKKVADVMSYYISRFIHIEGFGKTVVQHLTEKDYFAFDQCDHSQKLVNLVLTKYVAGTTKQYLKMVSRVLSGTEKPELNVRDTLMLQAEKLFNNKKCRRSTKSEK